MKACKYIILVILLFFVSSISAQSDSVFECSYISWESSFYISNGYGDPNGYRLEVGYNIGSAVSLALIYGIDLKWSNGSNIGIYGKVYLAHFKSGSIYLLLARAGESSYFGNVPDSYSLAQLGYKIPILAWVQLCIETGYVYTSEHVSGGLRSNYNNTSRYGINISIELDL